MATKQNVPRKEQRQMKRASEGKRYTVKSKSVGGKKVKTVVPKNESTRIQSRRLSGKRTVVKKTDSSGKKTRTVYKKRK